MSNPYQAPMSAYAPYAPPAQGTYGVTPAMIETLRATKPWVRFLAVLSFVGAGLMLIVAVAVAATQATGAAPRVAYGPWLALVYVAIAVIYLWPAVYMHRYANAIDELLVRGGPQELEAALAQQKSFWKTTGIVVLVMMGSVVLVFLGGVVAGIMLVGSR